MENSGSNTSDRHHQGEEVSPTDKSKAATATAERKPWPKPDHKVDCLRCKSPTTKFCYYNNYNMSQPRNFCKACCRDWTHGGSLCNVPIGGGVRKNRHYNANNNKIVSMAPPEPMVLLPTCMGFPNLLPTFVSAGFKLLSIGDYHLSLRDLLPSVAPSGTTSFLDVLRGGVLDGGRGVGNNETVQMPPPATTYVPPMQHGTISGATVAQGVVNGTMGTVKEGGLGDSDKMKMMGIQLQYLKGGIGLGSGIDC